MRIEGIHQQYLVQAMEGCHTCGAYAVYCGTKFEIIQLLNAQVHNETQNAHDHTNQKCQCPPPKFCQGVILLGSVDLELTLHIVFLVMYHLSVDHLRNGDYSIVSVLIYEGSPV